MNNPDVALEIKRDDNGRVTGLEYKVNNEGKDGKRALEGLDLMRMGVMAIFDAEGPEDHSTQVDVNVSFPFLGE